MRKVYYNEFDPFAAEWLKKLISYGYLPNGDVDSRSIKNVQPTDLVGYTQCHFFAGIGGWPLALKQAGWGDRQVWTGSCPCQPFSDAGKQKGFDDDRHLWPVFYNLIRQCQPNTVFGEQVASKIALAWLDDVQTDLEREDYAFSAVDLCAAGYGAPHIRQRLFWLANANNPRSQGWQGVPKRTDQLPTGAGSVESGVANTNGGNPSPEWQQYGGGHLQRTQDTVDGDGLDDTKSLGWSVCNTENIGATNAQVNILTDPSNLSVHGQQQLASEYPRPTNGFWRDADWLRCRDDKWRPVKPGTSPLAHGLSAGVGFSRPRNRSQRLKGYGNAIAVPVAVEFIKAYMEIEG